MPQSIDKMDCLRLECAHSPSDYMRAYRDDKGHSPMLPELAVYEDSGRCRIVLTEADTMRLVEHLLLLITPDRSERVMAQIRMLLNGVS